MTTQFKWIKFFSSVLLMLQVTAAAAEHKFIIRDGGEVTLSCENLKNDQDKCNGTTWIFSKSTTATITLFENGKIHQDAKNKSDRLSVTANCSLVIKKLTAEDAGQYTCRRFNKSGQQEGPDSAAELSVVNITEHKDDDTVTLKCSVSTHKECKYTVKWLDGNKDLETSQSTCSGSVIFTTSDHIYTSKSSEMLKCQVTHGGNVQEFIYRIQSLDQETHENARWWMFIVAPLGLLALIAISAVIAIRWKRAKGKKMETNENPELNLNPAVTPSAPGTTQDSAEPEYAVAYASISYTNTTSKAQGRDKNEGERVTYSTVKASSMDPSNLYDTIK